MTTSTERGVRDESRTSRNRKTVYVCAAALLVAISATAVWQFTLHKTQSKVDDFDVRKEAFPISGKPSIAVLPFENMTGDPQQQYFCDGMADQLITGLSQGPYIYVTARTSSFAFRGTSMTAQQIADKLGVSYLLEGSVQRDAERVRVNVQLVDGSNGNHVWAERYDSRYQDLFALQDKITMGVMAALNIQVTGYLVGDLKRARPNNLEAYEYYLKGWYYHLSRRPEDVLPARQAFEEAINLDPNFAEAYRGLGLVYMDEFLFGMSDSFEKTLERAEKAAQKALEADPDYPPYSLWCYLSRWKKDFDKAIEYGEKAVQQAPHDPGRYFFYGQALLYGEHFKEAITAYETYMQLIPFRPPNIVLPLGWAFIGNKEYDKAIPLFNEILENSKIAWLQSMAYQGLVVAYELGGNHEKARWAAENVMRVDPKFSLEIDEKQSGLKDGIFKKTIYDAFRSAGLK